MDSKELNNNDNNEEKNTEHYLNEIIKNQKKIYKFLIINEILFVVAIIAIKLLLTG